jgi:hypothetical protein
MLTFLDIISRLGAAMVIGSMVGLNREMHHKSTGSYASRSSVMRPDALRARRQWDATPHDDLRARLSCFSATPSRDLNATIGLLLVGCESRSLLRALIAWAASMSNPPSIVKFAARCAL